MGKQVSAYLLQVWSSGGKLLYERTMEEPPDSWNIHGDYLVF